MKDWAAECARVGSASACWGVLCLIYLIPCQAAEPLAGLLACRELSDDAARLACFDRESASLAARSAPPRRDNGASSQASTAAPGAAAQPAASGPAAPTTSAAVAQSAGADAGARTAASSARPQTSPSAAAQTAGAGTPPDPQKTFGLPPQAVTRQEVAAGTRPPDVARIEAHISQLTVAPNGRTVFTLDNDQVWRQLSAGGDLLAKAGESVTISRGLLGSFWLETEHGRGCKVTRVR